jgi:manganese transport protein
VILSLQLSFAVVPLVRFTSSRQKMGPFVSRPWVQVLAWLVTVVIAGLNAALVYQQIGEWMEDAGRWGWMVGAVSAPVAVGLSGLLVWMVFRRETGARETPPVSADQVVAAAAGLQKRFKRIGVALDAEPSDSAMLAEAIALARMHGAELVLMHVVSGVGGQWYGAQTGVMESRQDETYLHDLAEKLCRELKSEGVPAVHAVLGYGDPPREIVNLTREKGIDLVVLGGHGHKGLLDWLHGETITGVRHGLDVPILAVRG